MSTVNAAWRGPNVIKDGLAFYLDAASDTSYNTYSDVNLWKDISGNGNNGTLTNGPFYSSTNDGTIVFDGTNDYIVTGNTTLNLSTTANFSYCVWIYPNFGSTLNAGRAIIDSTGASPTYLRAYLRWEGTTLGFYFDIADSGGGSGWKTVSIPTFSANTWHHLCFTHDSSNAGTFYFDGATVSTSRVSSNAKTVTNNPITVGYGAVNGYYWAGSISNLQIYNVTLAATEVLQNYNATKARFGL